MGVACTWSPVLASLRAVDFVLGPSQESLLQAFDRWKGWADEKVCCDYSFHVGVTWWSPQVAKEMEVLCREKGQYSLNAWLFAMFVW